MMNSLFLKMQILGKHFKRSKTQIILSYPFSLKKNPLVFIKYRKTFLLLKFFSFAFNIKQNFDTLLPAKCFLAIFFVIPRLQQKWFLHFVKTMQFKMPLCSFMFLKWLIVKVPSPLGGDIWSSGLHLVCNVVSFIYIW